MQKVNDKKGALPEELAILPLKGTVIYPGLALPLIIGRERSIQLIDDALTGEKTIGVVTQKDPKIEEPREDEMYSFGVAVSILKMVRVSEKDIRVVVQGISRIKIEQFVTNDPYYRAKIIQIEENEEDDNNIKIAVLILLPILIVIMTTLIFIFIKQRRTYQ